MKTNNAFCTAMNTSQHVGKKALAVLLSAQVIAMPLLYTQQAAADEPAQAPLIASRTMASPNIMLIFDDSGSMTSLASPDNLEALAVGNFYRSSFHPQDNATTAGNPGSQAVYVIAADPADVLSAQIRSYQINKIYYNPASTYLPWRNADGSLMPAYPANAAPIYAATASSVTKVDLTGKNVSYTISSSYSYCTWSNKGNYCRSNPGAVRFTPALYFIYHGPDANNHNFAGWTASNTNLTNINNYTPVVIDDIPASGIRQASTRTDCAIENADGTRQCTKAEEYQNFSNWYVYYRGRTRSAIGALTHVFARDYGMRFRLGWANLDGSPKGIAGLGTYYYVKEGVRSFESGIPASFYSWLYQFERGTRYGTPTRAALNEAGKYYSLTANAGPWGAEPGLNNSTPHLACRKSYTIMVTDGGWNETFSAVGNADNTNGPLITGPDGKTYQYIAANVENRIYRNEDSKNSNSMADVAMYYWYRDLRPDLANEVPATDSDPAWWQHMTTYTVGFGVKGNITEDDLPLIAAGSRTWPYMGDANDAASIGRIDDLYHAAINGHGGYASASDVNALIESLGAMMESMAVSSQPSAHVVLASGYLEAGNRVYAPSYVTGQWTGELTAYKMTSGGAVGAQEWKATDAIPNHANRNIWIGTGGSDKAVSFQWNSLSPAMRTALQTQTLHSAEDLVNFLRGDNTYANNVTFRQRSSVLGDIVNSNPLYVKDAPSLGYRAAFGSSYSAYHNWKRSERTGMVFVGANDGMLHAFATEGPDMGKEMFAFIPHALLPRLGALASLNYDKNHRFYVDGYLTLTDANLNQCNAASCWRNVLLGSAGAGGKVVFALDVTDPITYAKTSTTPTAESIKNTVLWELTPDTAGSEMGFVMQPIQAGYTRTGDWVGIFGNGPYSDSGQAYLYVVNLKDGNIIHKIATDPTTDNGLMGVTLTRNSNQVITGAYAGDLQGNMWYFNMSSTDKTNWRARRVFTTQNNRPITQAPALYPHPDGGRMVLFGTGKFYDTADIEDTETEAIYGIWDNSELSSPPVISYNQLLHRTATSQIVGGNTYYKVSAGDIDWATQKGWDLQLTMKDGQRSLYTPTIIGTDVVFDTSLVSMNTATGNLSESCEVGGIKGVTLIVNLFSGGLPSIKWDSNGDGVINSLDDSYIGFHTDNSGPSYVGYNPGLLSDDPANTHGVQCPDGYVGASINGLAVCKKANDSMVWMQMF